MGSELQEKDSLPSSILMSCMSTVLCGLQDTLRQPIGFQVSNN